MTKHSRPVTKALAILDRIRKRSQLVATQNAGDMSELRQLLVTADARTGKPDPTKRVKRKARR